MNSNILNIFKYKELIFYFAWRDLKVRYKQTFAGALWVVLQPLALMTIFSIFLSQLGRQSGDDIPYPIFLYAGLTFWGLFSSILNTVSASVVTNSSLIKKVYFPRIVPALSNVLISLVDFCVSFSIFLVLFFVFDTSLNILGLIFFPVLVAIAVVSSLGLGLFLAALNVQYRDVKQALPFTIQAIFFLTPIIYPMALVPENVRSLLYLNPMTGVVVSARDLFFRGHLENTAPIIVAILVSSILFTIGLSYFWSKQETFVDIV